jgi:hypothetical protein
MTEEIYHFRQKLKLLLQSNVPILVSLTICLFQILKPLICFIKKNIFLRIACNQLGIISNQAFGKCLVYNQIAYFHFTNMYLKRIIRVRYLFCEKLQLTIA